MEIIKLDESIPLLTLQFNFSNCKVTPKIIKKINSEKQEERVARKKIASGVQVIIPTPNTSLLLFPKQLREAGYELVDAISQERINANANNSKYHMVRFVFSRHECAEPSEEFLKYSDIVHSELDKICRQALWRVRGYLNPFYKKGKNFVSINMEVRIPLISPKGKRIKRWEKDEKGKKVGEKSLPLFPDHFLSVKNEEIKLIKVSKALVRRAFLRRI
ncbi:MAG: hypothetical protein GWO87_01735 [Xanthomonadaceae bacterium]|nr:hypothetical protein [Rhodospirillaceae bacterium]NIA17892.1 hypothetical protein [Xanthomonadaceae bacterium]